ncbi:F-box only protein 42 [Diorhabda carinulata]|uniref:F-box only protein 42 n=1 Tax=Diorhabda sublineata TaxID=1163346 RepID=UPI0024E16FA6|nr:F-box only protein 42 [Diorhabda sublineata]XP_057671534.1 F-box only protein 42 [Diorhabda carinulata]
MVTDIESLPDEVLEFILSLIPPYKDLHDCMLVSKRWRRCVLNVVKQKQRNLYRAINEFDVRWERLTPVDMAPTISKRYSHTAVVHDNSMFVFGGCTCAMTTFNDLWRLDLTKRRWIRPLATGTYPSPKACSSMIQYKDKLILFGGWAYPPSYPLYQSWHLFNELHLYDIVANRWNSVTAINTPPPVAGHSVSIIGDWMILFGGLQKPCNAVHCEKSNDIWKVNLNNWTWYKQEVESGPKPNGRFGQTQVIINEENLLILGGSGGPTSHHCDAWILNMSGDLWKWKKVEIVGKNHQPSNIWSNPGCKIGDKIVVLNRIKETDKSNQIAYYPKTAWNVGVGSLPEDGRLSRIDLANRATDRDENVNGKRGTLRNHKREIEDEDAGSSNVKVFAPPNKSNLNMLAFNNSDPGRLQEVIRMREKRLANLFKVEENFTKGAYKREKKTHYLGVYVLDISKVLEEPHTATWLPPKNLKNGPEETILYTLVEGKSELVMFGGIQDANSIGFSKNLSSQISNSLHFITAPSYVI